jgi:hypothetical protein
MDTNRRTFLRTGAVGLAGVAAACGQPSDTGASVQAARRSSVKPFDLTIQFFGLMVHGSWPHAKPDDPRRVDVLLVNQAHHVPQLRIQAKDVVSHKSGKKDRYNPHMLWWPLKNIDVVVSIDGKAGGDVKLVKGKRHEEKPGQLAACPDPGNDDEFQDITWLPNLTELLYAQDNAAALYPDLKDDSSTIKPDDRLASRVRLTTGGLGGARPTLEEYETIKHNYRFAPYPKFQPQFYTDLVRFTGKVTSQLTLTLIPFGKADGEIIEIATDQSDAVVFVEHTDPNAGGHSQTLDFCASHFRPLYSVYKTTVVDPSLQPCPNSPKYCTVAGDPPYYCVPGTGDFH